MLLKANCPLVSCNIEAREDTFYTSFINTRSLVENTVIVLVLLDIILIVITMITGGMYCGIVGRRE